jgi:PAS domain S-box-containing protein
VTDLSGYVLETLREGQVFALYRGWQPGNAVPILVRAPVPTQHTPANLGRLEHEYSLADELDPAWAVRPLELVRHDGRRMLVLEDPGGDPLNRILGRPLELTRFLRIAIALAAAVRQAHRHGLIHKDIKPSNLLVDGSGYVRLMGFGIASRLPREHQAPVPPTVIAGTLAYMAPEQTGRMNRSIDARSDLYSLGITLYEMLTGVLPFTASDPMEWVHCHIARLPMPPGERVKGIPDPVAAIVLKLLAKTAEDRYQTAAGVEADLRRCLAAWEAQHRIAAFPLGAHDASDRLLIREKLYGREAETDALIAAFDRVVTSGATELVLVSGHAGIGKSSLVNELHKALVPPRGLFATGKFDQYKQNIPYATLAQAFQSLIQQILGKSDSEMSQWSAALLDALGPSGQLMVNLIPELALIIGEQPPVPELAPQDRQNRFQLVFRRFLGVFALPEHPLVLFLDDLQWLDTATLDLIEHLVVHPDVRHLLLVGAFRHNEVSSAHPLMRTLAKIRLAGSSWQEILLAPLKPDDVERLIADALHTEHGRARPLSDLVFEKTDGNPFFTIQFLTAMADEALVAFDPGTALWTWDLTRIRAKGFTDNVADLMAAKLSRLSHETQRALGLLACLGNVAETATLTLVHGGAEEAMQEALWEAVRAGFVLRSDSAYTFLHDRIQEAAYALVAEGERAMVHLRIGRLLAARTTSGELAEDIFDIVNQFDRGVALITTEEERELVADLNLMAGKRAKAATAYTSASRYFTAGRALLAENGWERCYRCTFDLEFNLAECEYLTGRLASAEERLSMLSIRAQTIVDFAAVTCVRLNLYTNLDQSDRAVGVGLDYLRQVDRRWSLHATAEDVRQDYDELWKRLGSRSIEALLDLPFMTDPDRCATMDVLTALASPALFTDEHLFRLVVGRMASLSLEHGNSDGSSLAYAWLGGVLGTYFGDYQAGFRFGRLGLDLVEKRGLDRFSARVYLVFAVHVAPWTQPLRTSCAFLRRAFKAAEEAGDLSYAAYSCIDLITNRFATGDPLDEVEREAESGFEFARKVWFGLASDCITGQLRLIRMLRGLTRDFTSFNDAEFDEGRFEQRLENNRQLAIGACWYWIRKLQARVYASDWASAVVAASKVAPLLWTAPTQFELAEYHFYGALARAAHCNMISAEERVQQLEALAAHHQQLALWAKTCPETFANRAALVGAEIARLEGRELDAERLYEEAIRLARKHSFIQNEGLGNELAARFYAARSFEKIAHAYLRDARYCYLHWGADGKVRQLNQLYPQLREEEPLPGPMSTIVAPVEHLDLATVIKVSQTVSGEIVLSKLIETLMRIAIEHAGAERGLLILFRSDKPRVEAEATTRIGRIEVTLRQAEVTVAELPESVLHYVMRTRESVILDDAAALTLFSADAYVQQRRPRSVLCLPLVKQAKLVGALYLENNLTPRAFTSDRIAVLELLASQAAISLENAELYADLQQENADRKRVEEELRRSESFLAEGQRISHTGSWGWNLSTGKLVWSEEHCRIFGFDPKKTEPTLQSFWERVHPEDRSLVEQTLDGAIRERSGFALEFRIALPDGSNKHLHGVGRPVLKAAGNIDEYIGTTMDITERKRGEEALRNAQADLTRVARLTTMGELAASIAHEISQPLGAMVANGDACLLWLANDRPNLDEARQAVKRIVGEGQRAGDIIRSVRALAGKSGPEMTQFDINDAIREVLILMRSELRRHDVSLETELSGGLEPIMGDRVQLQQVILNLIMNGIEAMSMVMHQPRVLRVRSQIDWPSIVLIAIEDSGPGFAPETMDHLFEAFFTTKLSGMGMGLSICRSIIDAHGGRLWASPRSPQGAVFQFTVPTVVKAGA